MGQAKCFACLTPHQQYILRTYLLALIAMGDTSIAGVQSLSAASTCFACLTYEELLAAKQYLMAVWLGLDTTKTGIIAQAATAACDFACLTPKQAEQLRTYLLAVTAGVSTTAAGVRALEAAAKCFNCLESKQQLEAQVYLLSTLAPGAPTTPAAIMQGAKCYLSCVPPELHEAFQTSLFAQVTSRSTPPCVTPTAPGQPSAFSTLNNILKISWTQPANSGSLIQSYTVSYGTTQGGPYTSTKTVQAGTKQAILTGLSSGTTYYFVVTANSFAGCSSAASTEGNATTSGTPPLDPAVIDWANRTVINGASVKPSNAVQLAVNTFVTTLKTAGVWTKLHMLNLMAWDSTATIANNKIYMKTPQIVGCGIDPWSDTGMPNGNFTINGIQANNGVNLIDCFDGVASNISNCLVNPNSASIFIYAVTVDNTNAFDWGMSDTVNGIIITSFFAASGSQGYVANIAHPATSNTGVAVAGYWAASRTANNRLDIYWASSTHPHSSMANDVTVNTFTLSNLHSMPLGQLNNNGAPFGASTRTFSACGLADGLSSADSLALFNAIQAVRTSFGGGFV